MHINFTLRIFPVVDVFDEWCGYTKVLEPTYNRLTLEVDDFEERIKLLAVCVLSGCLLIFRLSTVHLCLRSLLLLLLLLALHTPYAGTCTRAYTYPCMYTTASQV